MAWHECRDCFGTGTAQTDDVCAWCNGDGQTWEDDDNDLD